MGSHLSQKNRYTRTTTTTTSLPAAAAVAACTQLPDIHLRSAAADDDTQLPQKSARVRARHLQQDPPYDRRQLAQIRSCQSTRARARSLVNAVTSARAEAALVNDRH